jgi:hypothetical protein
MGSEEFFGKREQLLDAGLETGEGFEAFLANGVVRGFEAAGLEVGVQQFLQDSQLSFGGVEFGSEEPEVIGAEQFAEIGLDLVVVLAVAGFPDLSDGVPSEELAGAGGDAGLADFEGLGDFVEGEGVCGEIEKAEDLAAGSGEAEALAEAGGHFDHLHP